MRSIRSRGALRARVLPASLLILVLSCGIPAQDAGRLVDPGFQAPGGGKPLGLKYSGVTFEIILADYAVATGKTLLIDPNVPKGGSVNLRSPGELSREEWLQAIETVLSMHGIALLKTGDKFLKVVPIANARTEAMDVNVGDEPLGEKDELVSQLVRLKHIDIKEAQDVIKNYMHTYGKVHAFERTNSLLITDMAPNINRIVEILGLVDLPVERLEEPHVIQIRFAKASVIKTKLEQIIAESQEQAKKSTVPRQSERGAPGVTPAPPTIPGVIRAPRVAPATPEEATALEIIEQAEKGMIRGTVKIIDDDRTNILIIITRAENMPFFKNIVELLDVETQPDVIVKIIRLEYASADTVAETLNTLIGKTAKDTEAAKGLQPKTPEEEAKAAALKEFISQAKEDRTGEQKEKSKVGELSASNIKILSDKRTNSLLVMASKGDLAAIEEIVGKMDMMLLQVMIEAVIVQVDLDDTITSGMHWIQRSLIVQERNAGGGVVPKGSIAGSAGAGRGDFITGIYDPANLVSIGSWAESGGLTAYFTFFGLNLDSVVKLAKSDTRTKILASPRVVTTDNTKAALESSEQKYFLKGSTVDQFGNVRPETEIKDIGLTLEVTPHINERRNVMMEIKQTVSDVAGSQQIADQGTWPTTKKRTFTASIAVRDGETIVLGGLVRKSDENQKAGVPVLSSIPFLGRLFSYKSSTERQSEMVVFITPYVLETPEEIAAKSAKMKEMVDIGEMWGAEWSDSKLAVERHKGGKTGEVGKKGGEVAVPGVEETPVVKPEEKAAAGPLESAVPEPEEKGAASKPEADALEGLDPELRDFILRQERLWGRKLEKIDKNVGREKD